MSWEVNAAFDASDDILKDSNAYLEALLERDVRVLIYAGTYDLICNFVGNDKMTQGLEWHGQRAFTSQPLREWFVDDKPAGVTRSFGQLTFASVKDAGHMVRGIC